MMIYTNGHGKTGNYGNSQNVNIPAKRYQFLSVGNYLILLLTFISLSSIYYFYIHGQLISYGDTESHLNIAKRVVDSITPGLAQLGGIWLPLPHLLLVPFVKFDFLWRTGLAGSIVSGTLFVVSGVYLFKLIKLITGNVFAGIITVFVYVTNPNILYLQTTAMTEIPLISFFIISIYYFVDFIKSDKKVMSLVYAGLFGLAASLSRYDGWFLVLMEAGLLVIYYFGRIARKLKMKGERFTLENILSDKLMSKMEAMILLFSTLAMIGIVGWFLWDYIILNDPLYFTNSPFSAKSQQMGWLSRGELPSKGNILSSFSYYGMTSYLNIGKIISIPALLGFLLYITDRRQKERLYATILLLVPFIFYVVTLYLGQSVIFIPQLTPKSFEWNLFNVRYGVMMVPTAAFYLGFFFHRLKLWINNRFLLVKIFAGTLMTAIMVLMILQPVSFVSGNETAVTIEDGVYGLSSAKVIDAQGWLANNYNGGLVLMDDYARTVSVIKSGLPMQNIIYIGNKPYWEESLKEPEKYADWVVMQQNDAVWKNFMDDKNNEARLYKYFQKAYTSPEILIFEKSDRISSK